MNKFIIAATAIISVSISLTSCYSTRLFIGDVSKTEPLVEVNKVWNHHLIGGLIPLDNASMNPTDFVGDRPNYVVKTNMSVLNWLVSGITYGLYTPTQTKYYIPLSEYNN